MIAFSCFRCGMKFKVKPRNAGRSAQCPTCKQQLVVPALSEIEAAVPAGQIDGLASSIARAGLDGGVSLEQAGPPGQKPIRERLARQSKKDQRYIIEGEIARGGMGAVLRAIDSDLRREVAVKYLLNQKDPKKQLRFVEEAQITGQLEHPNIVPIHELGLDARKQLFFTMKMVKGRSLAQVLDELRERPRTAAQVYNLGRLLNILVNVCNALAYAHARGVVHRDLKPANIMTGDFGEVYVMDWGLAKVLAGGEEVAAPLAVVLPPDQHVAAVLAVPVAQPTQRTSKVATDRGAETDLTQDGAILGTPVYMSPEQASGQLAEINVRSDVYSMGAILYEMLTLEPPVDKAGGYLPILWRVIEGKILSPELRNVERARAGLIPRELSAIAMKALAKDPKDRYPTIEALRRDVERYQEGRSVSAKADTTREMLWKVVKRNKAVSAALFVLLPVLLVLLGLNLKNSWAYEREQAEKEKRTKRAVPAMAAIARQVANSGDLSQALEQIGVILDYDSGNAEVRLLRGQIFIVQQKFAAGRGELEEYLRRQPGDAGAQQLAKLCPGVHIDNPAVLVAMAEVLESQQNHGMAARLLEAMQTTGEVRKKLLPLYQKQIEAAWPGHGVNLKLSKEGLFSFELPYSQVKTLDPLKGLPLHNLRLSVFNVNDLTPLQGMPLTSLSLGCKSRDLTPLKGMPLVHLNLAGTPMSDLSPLKGMPLTSLCLSECYQVRDLTPLKGMPLTYLDLFRCGQVQDLTPLKGMPLAKLSLLRCGQVRDLTPLAGMPLTSLNIFGSDVRDLTPLKDMNLESICIHPKTTTQGMDILRRMKSLKAIAIGDGNPAQLSAPDFWKRYDAGEFK